MGKLQANGRAAAALLLLAGLSLFSGCVERRYTIRSDPPGATVIVNGEEIGPSPASKSFVYYGDREITLMLDGYETKTVIQPIKAPWWDNLLHRVLHGKHCSACRCAMNVSTNIN